MRLMGAASLKDLTPKMVWNDVLSTSFLHGQIERVDWQPLARL